MTSGVLIAQIMTGSYIHFLFEGVGYMIHGTGLIPFVDWFSQERSTNQTAQLVHHEPIQEGMGIEEEEMSHVP